MIKFKWEESFLEIPLPDISRMNWLEPVFGPPLEQSCMIVDIRNDLHEIAPAIQNAAQIVLILEDPSRASLTGALVDMICRGIEEIRGERKGLEIVIAAGAHYHIQKKDLEKKIPLNLGIPITVHDATDYGKMESIGISRSGNPLFFNKRIVQADLRLSVSTVNIHPLAGFSGGGKILLPGVAGLETIRALHELPPGTPGDDHSAMREFINEAMVRLPITFSWHIISDPGGKIIKIFSGNPETSRNLALAKLKNLVSLSPPHQKARLLLLGCRPFNLNLIGAFKSLHQIPRLLEEGGSAILFIEAAQGVGYHHWRNDPEVVGAQKERYQKLLREYRINVFTTNTNEEDFKGLFPDSFSLLKTLEELKNFINNADFEAVTALPCAPVTLIT